MQSIDCFTLVSNGEDALDSELRDRDRVFSPRISGRTLEAQHQLQQGGQTLYLVLTSDDVPYEEILHATLIDEVGKVLDVVELGAPLTPGVLERVRVLAPDTLAFDFQGEVALTVLEEPSGLFRRGRLQVRRSGAGSAL